MKMYLVMQNYVEVLRSNGNAFRLRILVLLMFYDFMCTIFVGFQFCEKKNLNDNLAILFNVNSL